MLYEKIVKLARSLEKKKRCDVFAVQSDVIFSRLLGLINPPVANINVAKTQASQAFP